MYLFALAFWSVLFSMLVGVFFVAHALAGITGLFAALFLFAWLLDRLMSD